MILAAPTSFKGTHPATAVAAAMARGAHRGGAAAVCELPVSDGGPGLIESLQHVAGGEVEVVTVGGPTGEPVRARMLRQPEHADQGAIPKRSSRAVLESADACGLALVPPGERDPYRTTTYGVGELLLAAAGSGAARIIIGLGGSGTVDAGLGMAQALGFDLRNARGEPVPRNGRAALELDRISGTPPPLAITALADVRNPLFGPLGAPRIFGPQKGATAAQVEALDAAFARVADIMRRDLGADVARTPGAGAAGGLGAALLAFTNAEIRSGSEWLLRELDFDTQLNRASLLITGEGCYDSQSAMGKITGEVVARARAAGVPVLIVAGRIEGTLPPGVHGLTENRHLSLDDIEALVAAALPRLLTP